MAARRVPHGAPASTSSPGIPASRGTVGKQSGYWPSILTASLRGTTDVVLPLVLSTSCCRHYPRTGAGGLNGTFTAPSPLPRPGTRISARSITSPDARVSTFARSKCSPEVWDAGSDSLEVASLTRGWAFRAARTTYPNPGLGAPSEQKWLHGARVSSSRRPRGLPEAAGRPYRADRADAGGQT